MPKFFILLLLVFATSYLTTAQQKSEQQRPSDPFDLSSSREKIGKLGLPTVSIVADLENKAKQLFAAGNWKEANPALERYAKQANTLANLISAGLEPFYGASYDDRRSFSGTSALVNYESLANEYKTKRNRAMVMQGECLISLGQKDEGAAMLIKALDLISIDDKEWWTRARTKLYSLLDVK